MNQNLEKVLSNNPAIWRATQVAGGLGARQGLSTGWPALDQALPDSGWPAGALTELLVGVTGAGELSLVMPALRAISAEGKGIALLGTPYLPQARAWEAAGIALERLLIVDADGTDLLWAAEQILRSGECGAVLVWSQHAGRALNHRALQRLHLAAGTGNSLCFLYRSVAVETSPSPAPLRLRLAAQAGGLHLHVVKCRGIARAKPIVLRPFPAHWNAHVAAVAALVPASTATQAQARASLEIPKSDATSTEVPKSELASPQIPMSAPTSPETPMPEPAPPTIPTSTVTQQPVTVQLALV
jgi:protein ImuA